MRLRFRSEARRGQRDCRQLYHPVCTQECWHLQSAGVCDSSTAQRSNVSATSLTRRMAISSSIKCVKVGEISLSKNVAA